MGNLHFNLFFSSFEKCHETAAYKMVYTFARIKYKFNIVVLWSFLMQLKMLNLFARIHYCICHTHLNSLYFKIEMRLTSIKKI